MIEPIRERGLRQSNQLFNLALSGHSKILVREPHVRAVWGRCVSKYSMVLGVEVEIWTEAATGVLERLVGHCLGGMCFLNTVGPLSSPVSRALECAVPACLPGKKRERVCPGRRRGSGFTKLAPKRELLIAYYLYTVLTLGSAKKGFRGGQRAPRHTETPIALSSKEVWPLTKRQRISWLTQAVGRNSQRPQNIGRVGVAVSPVVDQFWKGGVGRVG